MAPRILRSLGHQSENKKVFAITNMLLVSVLVLDSSLFRIAELIRIYVTPEWTITLFVFMSVIFLMGHIT
jgi:hypothetical protein